MAAGIRTEQVEFADLAGWEGDDHAAALAAFVRHCARDDDVPAKTGRIGVDGALLLDLCRTARAVRPDGARAFFEANFQPLRIGEPGFLTAYFEPELAGSRKRTDRFRVPLLSKPGDLVRIDDENRPAGLPAEFAFGRLMPDGRIVEHPDRGAIMDGALDGRDLELVWLEDPVDAFYVHVQGSARIRLTDGTAMRVAYAAKTGHSYFPIGRVMIERGLAEPGTVTMEVLRNWLAANPGEIDSVLRRNRSNIFFREVTDADPDAGPVGAAGIQLSAGRSLAVDRMLHTFGTPVFVEGELPAGNGGGTKPFARLMIAQDTGSAIVGAARGDLFIGSGAEAGAIAGDIQHKGRFTLLVPRSAAGVRP
ncbi:MltA domain-containing protein [Stappia sp. F7233]|uniref:peptidoglycan lytic exotransglycosylase n=1 Tax=Stappia albiluteola TaxID=2758565 RepID=A0A839AIQ1_9HYPH|nr:MltA domain-containing protein [Stappia albiluteola]